MPSRLIPTVSAPTPSSSAKAPHNSRLLPPLAAATATTAAFSFLFFLVVCFRKITRNRTAPEVDTVSKPPHSLPYSVLRRATDSFAASRRLGQGGFGPVFYGTLPKTNQEIAVKVMDSGSLQGEREFQNELFFAAMLDSRHVVSVLGFSSDRKRRRMLLVYDYMHNGNLQDALLHRKCPELMVWNKRFLVAVDIAKGLEYLHRLDQPIIHGDIKPSNILLDKCFSAKIGDFGLARLKMDIQTEIVAVDGCDGVKANGSNGGGVDDYGSVVEEIESVTTGFEDSNVGFDFSPEVCAKVETSPEPVTESPAGSGLTEAPEGFEKGSVSEGNVDKVAEASPEPVQKLNPLEKQSVEKDWWLKQGKENNDGAVKDYVMEWIGTEINNERPKIGTASSSFDPLGKTEKKKKKSNRKQLDWWISMDEEKSAKILKKKEKRRPAREWWKEEYCEELAKKKKKRMKQQQKGAASSVDNGDDWWLHDEELYSERKKRNKSRSKGSLDWWLDGLSGELRRGWRNGSHDSGSGEIPKSGGYSSTPSMRGTVCYVAPETGFGGNPSEKCDVYSFGVSLLVLIAGRRPLQVTNSPMSEYQRANLLSWARHLARAGKLIDLVDKSIQSLDREQALLCIKVALLCLQKIPARRPSMKEVVGMLTGELELPQLPADLSPSPPQSRFPFKTHKKVR
ncbi:receptor-like serine/threonine-protein kinase At4g25390 [Humulus lupulus]|uniref:receptor-like serine/threonine-protein kinase At4g25390 n=1 Tax=Humulus lupulus TaxID=3486 RepID=UPI002B413DF0|nr:receptor-like serine/threonine-protein kinase At4g25390 [Humulus lupulus]